MEAKSIFKTSGSDGPQHGEDLAIHVLVLAC